MAHMKTVLKTLTDIVNSGFETVGVASREIEVSYSRRPDLCDFQCSNALKLAKDHGQKPLELANLVCDALQNHPAFSVVTAQAPGFINLTISPTWLVERLNQMASLPKLGFEPTTNPKKILVDYGGANCAKSLHVGHLRSAVIGESIIRLLRFSGHQVIGDIHLGDWGLQIGYVIEMVRLQDDNLPYFDSGHQGNYPEEPPFDIAGLTALYTAANVLSKTDEDFKAKSAQATLELQMGNKGYIALWQHILKVSIPDLKKNYGLLQVYFDLWLGESDSETAIPVVIERLKKQGLLVPSEGAMVVHVKTDKDQKPMPPCIMQKSNGAYLYATTDLATIYQRVKDQELDGIVYVVDKRQDLHFEQVIRVARRSQIVADDFDFVSIGFGTMNGKDGKPFKTRDGGVMALGDLIELLIEGATKKLDTYSHVSDIEEKEKVALAIGVGALKFGDLSNLPNRDYVFDIDQFANFEGKTGPYVQYAGVRIASILDKLGKNGIVPSEITLPKVASEHQLMSKLASFSTWVEMATTLYQPSKICDYVFELAQCFNGFYHEVLVLKESPERQANLYALLDLTQKTIETCLWLLGIEAPEKM